MTCCIFLAVFLGQLTFLAARADDKDEIVSATKSYEAANAKAEQTLLAAFEKAEDNLRKSTFKAEVKQTQLELLKGEKHAFQDHGYYPWSARMRPALIEFLRARGATVRTLERVYDNAINDQTKAKNDVLANELIAKKKEALKPVLIGTWELTGTSWKGSWTCKLFSNGHYSDPFGKAVWTFDKGIMILTQPELGFPNNTKLLKWTIRENGLELDEMGNNGASSVGKLENSAQIP